MRFSNDNISFSAPESYVTTKASWPLSAGNGSKTVYAQFKDSAGGWSGSFNDSILVDSLDNDGTSVGSAKPQVTAFSASSPIPQGGSTTISWTVTDSGGSNLKWVQVWRTSDSGGAPNSAGWIQVGPNHNAPVGSNTWSSSTTDSPPNGTWWYGLHVEDNATNQATESDLPAVGPKKVIVNSPPSANSLSAEQSPPCADTSADLPRYTWTYTDPDSNNMSQFQVKVYNNGSFTDPPVQDYGVRSGVAASGSIFLFVPTPSGLSSHVSYWWRLQVWDSLGTASGWINAPSSFQIHLFPVAQYTKSVASPSVGEPVQFTETSEIRDPGATKFTGPFSPSSPLRWTFEDAQVGSSCIASHQTDTLNPVITFCDSSDKEKDITLRVRDSNNHECTKTFLGSTTGVKLKPPLPKFFPVIPF
jgi:hypothetical protein